MTDLEEALLGFMHALPANCWIKDQAGRYLYLSPTSQRLFGPSDGVAIGRTAYDLFPPEFAAELVASDQQVVATGEVSMTPMWLPAVDGARRHLGVVKFPIAVGATRYVGGFALDITSLSASNWDSSTYRQILDAFSDLILVKGPRSQLRWANKAFLAAYGMTNEQLQGLVDAPFAKPDQTQQYVRDDEQVFSTGRTLDIPDEPMTYADGTVHACHTVKSPIFDASGRVAMTVAVIRDTTARKRLELELGQAQKLESIGRLAAGMAHEINTPIQFVGDQTCFVKGAVDDLLALVASYQRVVAKVAAGTATPADAAEAVAAEAACDLTYVRDALPPALESILDGTHRVAVLVRAMKEFGHPDAGVKRDADVNAALRNAVIVASNEYKHVADVVLELGELARVRCNISELNQVFLNLIVNAAHAIADVGKHQRGTIRITTREDGGDVVISIADTGTGIPADARRHLFDPFFTTKEIGRGTGQGLAIARMIVVDKHQGSLTFETECGHGTTFHVRLPRPAPDGVESMV